MTLIVSQVLEGISAFVCGWFCHKAYVGIRYRFHEGTQD
jgi:hypothetical protein